MMNWRVLCSGMFAAALVAGTIGCDDAADDKDNKPVAARCGDAVVNGREVCDGAALNEKTCATEGFADGVLTCNATCDAFETAACTAMGEACDSAQEVTAGTIAGTTAKATADVTLSCGNASGSGPDLVYSVTLAEDSGLMATVSGYDTVLEVRKGSCAGGTVVGCNDDHDDVDDFGSRVKADFLTAGQYFIVVSSYSDGEAFSLAIEVQAGGYPRCGDATIDASLNEICDGATLDTAACSDFGWDDGTLGCNDHCTGYDFSGCNTSAVCDGASISGPEVCDGLLLDNESCVTQGFVSGTLACATDCQGFDVSGCVGLTACGDGVRQVGEACDGSDMPGSLFGPLGCTDFGLAEGTLSCSDDCTLDYSGCGAGDMCTELELYGDGACHICDSMGGAADTDCVSACGADGVCADRFYAEFGMHACENAGLVDPDCACGDNFADGAEYCDGTDLAGFTCAGLGFYEGGTVACRADCLFDTTGCAYCGDGTTQAVGGEICDGADVGSKTCADFGFDGGTLTCNSVCRGYDVSHCTTTELCDGSAIAGPEVCDGASNLAGNTCESLGYATGTLGCAENCLSFDTAACSGFDSCGDTIAVAGEPCDGANFDMSVFNEGAPCSDVGLGAGALACTSECTLSFASCEDTDVCTANDWYGDGFCDPCDVLGGVPDTDCVALCAADGQCANYYDTMSGLWTCTNAGFVDPDCEVCGNGLREGSEWCDGADLGGATCVDAGYTSGDVGCRSDCLLDLSGCTP